MYMCMLCYELKIIVVHTESGRLYFFFPPFTFFMYICCVEELEILAVP